MNQSDFIEELSKSSPTERSQLMRAKIECYIRKIMIINEEETVDQEEGFFDLGLDSLTAVELKNSLQSDISDRFELTSTEIFNYPSITKLAKYILDSLELESAKCKKTEEGVSNQPESSIEEEVESLSKEDILKHLQNSLKDK